MPFAHISSDVLEVSYNFDINLKCSKLLVVHLFDNADLQTFHLFGKKNIFPAEFLLFLGIESSSVPREGTMLLKF